MEYFNNLQNTSEDKVLKFNDGTDYGGEFSNIKEAKNLKPKKNICSECNSSKSTDCDMYFDRFVIEEFHWQENISEIQSMLSPTNEEVLREADHQRGNLTSPIDDTLWMDGMMFVNAKYLLTSKYQIFTHPYDEKLIKKYLAKHSICYFDRTGIEIPPKLRDIFLHGKNLDVLDFTIYFLPPDFQHGYLNTMIKMPEEELRYALIFSNLAIHVVIKR